MKILFVCTGNTCRSPMAEAILKDYLKTNGIFGVTVSSCGLNVDENSPVTEEKAIVAVKKMGIYIRKKKAKQITDKMLNNSDYVITMTLSQKKYLNKSNVYTLAELSNLSDIPDPYQKDQNVYDVTAYRICMAIENMMQNYFEGKL